MKKLNSLSVLVSLLLAVALSSACHAAWTKNGPAQGRWEISPARLISGQKTRIELRYTNGDQPLPPNSGFKFDMEPLSVKEFEHCPLSTDLQPAELDASAPEVVVKVSKPHGVGYIPVQVKFPKGVKPRQGVTLVYGNKAPNGEITALVIPVPVHNLSYNILYTEPGKAVLDWFDMGWWKNLPRCSIDGGPPSALRIFAPSLVKSGMPFRVRVAVTDDFDSECCPSYSGKVSIVGAEGVDGLPQSISYNPDEHSTKVIDGVSIAQPGVYRIACRLNGKDFESNPIVVRADVQQPLFWGLLHSHNWYSECWGDGTYEHYRFGRDTSGLDFLALSDHIGRLPNLRSGAGRLYAYRHGKTISGLEAWKDSMAAADHYHEPGRFVTLIGYETGTKSCCHNNVYWADATQANYEKMFADGMLDYPCQNSAAYGKVDAIVIPHLHATYIPYNELFVNRTQSGLDQTPVIECYSDWGMAFPGPGDVDSHIGGVREKLGVGLNKVIARGLNFGLVGDSDTHTGWPGRRFAGEMSPGHNCPAGLTAVKADELTRRGIVAAYRSRDTYATSGERIFLDVSANGTAAGRSLETDVAVDIKVEIAGTDIIERVDLFDGEGIVQQQHPLEKRDVTLNFRLPAPTGRPVPYFVQVVQKDHHRAWSSPIWIGKKSLPDLAWEQTDDGTLFLINKGRAPAVNVRVVHDQRQYPFARPEVGPQTGNLEEPCGQVWLRRWSDSRATLFLHWKGSDVSYSVALNGCRSYCLEPNRGQWWHGTVDDDGRGTLKISNHGGRVATTQQLTRNEWRGIDLTLEPSGEAPCNAVLRFDHEARVYCGNESHLGKTITIPINGLVSGQPLATEEIAVLEPGERWQASDAGEFWSADPLDKIVELGEDNNLFSPAKPR